VRSLHGLDTTGLAALLPTLPVGLACHGRTSEHVGENKMSLLTGGEQANVVRGDEISNSAPPSEMVIGILNEILDGHHRFLFIRLI